MDPRRLNNIFERLDADFPHLDTRTLLVVDVVSQRIHLLRDGRSECDWPVSTAANGVGGEEGSHRTPPGMHRIRRKIGDGLPPGAVMRGRVPTGECALPSQGGGEDVITSRILWLEGMEPGVNRGPGIDSFDRYIYIHGTNDAVRIGTPVSRGCVRMRDADVIDLYGRVACGTPVVILTPEGGFRFASGESAVQVSEKG